ncbi:hypothetical protein [Pedobacter sp.]|uniref:hypothetical protein n=1 Tax=Pedobacter sp. TaxID=1411316 RepID=UPI003D7F4F29
MKKITFTLTACILFLAACSTKPTSDTKEVTTVKTINKSFSDTTTLDTFEVTLSGNKPKDMLLTFKIKNNEGKEIYEQVLQASDLLDNYKETVDLGKEKMQRDFMLQELNYFLDEENFLEPAVTPNETADQFTPNQAFYNELKGTNFNGFKYRISRETKIYIAWSEKDKRVKIYYKCC